MPDLNEQIENTDIQNAGTDDSALVKDAFYSVEYADDGVFINASYEDQGGLPILPAVLTYDLNRRDIAGLDIVSPLLRVRRHEQLIRIADAQPESSAATDVFLIIPRDEMSANMVLLPPCGAGPDRSADELLAVIREKWGVVFGLDESAVRRAVSERRYYLETQIAAGRPAEKGEDGKVVLLFNTQRSYAPTIAKDGSADYKSLKVFESVKEGETVATLVQPSEGVDGCTVKGRAIPAQRGRDSRFPKGKNVRVSEDGLSLLAVKSGRVDYIMDRIEVADVFRIAGDVDMGVGNIQFDGDVIVFGNVISGLTIEATGTVEIGGYVEASTIIAGKDIILKNGMQGMEKGCLKAGGNIVARFMERSTVEAQGSIISDSIVHCSVTAGDFIKMQGKWARILGGTLRAGRMITANTIGSTSNELTVIEMGASAEMRAHCTRLTTVRDDIKSQLDKVSMMIRVIPAHSESAENQQYLSKLAAAKDQLQQQYSQAATELEELMKSIEELSRARLHVLKAIYPNVKISINMCSTTTKTSAEYVTFYFRSGGIVSTSCEARS